MLPLAVSKMVMRPGVIRREAGDHNNNDDDDDNHNHNHNDSHGDKNNIQDGRQVGKSDTMMRREADRSRRPG